MHDDHSFIERYRLPNPMVLEILVAINNDIAHLTNRSHAITPITQLLAILRFYAKGGFCQKPPIYMTLAVPLSRVALIG